MKIPSSFVTLIGTWTTFEASKPEAVLQLASNGAHPAAEAVAFSHD